MAKNKTSELEYKTERLRRTSIRKQKRRDGNKDKIWRYGKQSESKCPDCGGQRSWCSGCQVWSQTCCVEYGTCQCS